VKKEKLPQYVEMGPFRVNIRLLSHDASYEIAEQQGSFHSKPPLTINLDESIMNMHNEVSLNLLVHELFHLCHYQYHLEGATEEVLVNAYANFTTELLMRSNIKKWIISVLASK
jgi:hypothetical protein